MAKGSPDYWSTQSNFLSGLISAIKASITSGGELFGVMDSLDGKLDGVINLTDLKADMVTALANLLGIETSVETGGNLIAAIDILDGTMDGKLTLSELNSSSVKTNLDTTNTKLQTSITRLDTTILRLIDIIAVAGDTADNTETLTTLNYMDVSGCVVICEESQVEVTLIAHRNNTNSIRIYNSSTCGGSIMRYLTAGQIVKWGPVGSKITVSSSGGTQKLAVI